MYYEHCADLETDETNKCNIVASDKSISCKHTTISWLLFMLALGFTAQGKL